MQLKAQGTTELESALAEAKARAAELLPLEEALRVKEEDAQAMSDRIAQQQAELLHIKQEKLVSSAMHALRKHDEAFPCCS